MGEEVRLMKTRLRAAHNGDVPRFGAVPRSRSPPQPLRIECARHSTDPILELVFNACSASVGREGGDYNILMNHTRSL